MSKSHPHSFGLMLAIALATGLAVAGSVLADQILVPSRQPTIQAGIDAAVDGDEVIIADGTYTGAGNVNCSFGGRLITVRSASDNPEACFIDCENVASTRAFTFNTGETTAAVVRGVTMTRGTGPSPGGGAILMDGASPTIENCRFIDNSGSNGGAIACRNGSSAVITDCFFQGNEQEGGLGGAVYVQNTNAQALFINCTLSANVVGAGMPGKEGGGGVWVQQGGTATFQNSIVYNNFPDSIGSNSSFPGTIISTFSNIEDGPLGIGSFDMTPVFTSPNGPDTIPGTLDDDYSLRGISPGIDSGDNSLVPAGVVVDLAGNPRFVDDPETVDMGAGRAPLVDMGCYEFQPGKAPCLGDLDDSGVVGFGDLLLLLNSWGPC